MNIFGLAVLGLIGGGAAKMLDRHVEQPSYDLKVSETRTIKLMPGAIASVALATGLALLPGSNATGVRAGLAAMSLGGVAVEGTDIFKDHVFPALERTPAVKGLPGYGAKALPQQQHQSHVGVGPTAGDRALHSAMERWGRGPRRARAA
jgi:hypothetical protein